MLVLKGKCKNIYLFDSLCKQNFSVHPSIKIQLAALYGSGKSKFKIYVVQVGEEILLIVVFMLLQI